MSKITFEDKEQLITNPNIPRKNKVVADDVNEIKRAINDNDDNITELDTRKADKTEIPTNLNQLSNADTKFVNETQLANAVQQETTARQQQDVELQNQIDAITSQSDVVDVVGTYQELMDYDTSTITENDIIKVLQDSTHDNATSYFRWSNNSWVYVGNEGPYYTKGETDERLNQKANQTSLDQTNENLNTLAGRVGTNETEITGIKAEQTTQNRQIATLIADSGNKIELSVNSQTYILTATLKNKAGETLNTSQVDLPLEAMIVNATYDSTTKELVLTLQNGTTLRVSLADIVSGLVSQDDFDSLEGRVDDLESDVADIKDEQDTQNAEIEELQEQVEILENTVNSELEDGTAIGESISVTDSANALAKLLPSGRTEQNQYEGKNLYSGGDQTFVQYKNVTIEPIPAGTYIFSAKMTSTDTDYPLCLAIFIGESGQVGSKNLPRTIGQETSVSESITLTDTCTLVRLFASNNNINSEGDTATFSNVMISAEGGDYEPYVGGQPSPNPEYPQQIHVVKGHNEILYQNRNLFDKDKNIISNYAISTSTGEISYSRGDFYQEIYIKVKSATKYVISSTSSSWLRVIEYDSAKNFIKGNGPNASVITTTSNTKYVRITTSLSYINSIQFEEGSVATAYVPHEEQTLELDLPEGMEMCGIGDYADTFEKQDGKWYKKKIINKIIFNSSSGFRLWTIQDNKVYFYRDNIWSKNYPSTLGYMTHFKRETMPSNIYSMKDGAFAVQGSIHRLWISSFATPTLEDFNDMLSNNPVTFYYVLQEPILEEITDQTLISQLDKMQKLLSYFGGTTITTISAGDLQPILNFEYKKSTRLRIETIEEKINSIQGG